MCEGAGIIGGEGTAFAVHVVKGRGLRLHSGSTTCQHSVVPELPHTPPCAWLCLVTVLQQALPPPAPPFTHTGAHLLTGLPLDPQP